jgi:hypothetical protein
MGVWNHVIALRGGSSCFVIPCGVWLRGLATSPTSRYMAVEEERLTGWFYTRGYTIVDTVDSWRGGEEFEHMC